MRGDSLRDLYAKTIAVCGLGLLAAAGALVDYWPTGVVMSPVGPAFAPPQLASALPVPKNALTAPARDAKADRADVASVRAPERRLPEDNTPRNAEPLFGRPSGFQTSFVQTTALDVAPAAAPHFGEEIALHEPVLALRFNAAYAPLGEEITLTEPSVDSGVVMASTYAAPVATSSDDGNGFISGATSAFKKTGSSIANAGSKAGAAIVGGFRTAGGVMRRVNPFN